MNRARVLTVLALCSPLTAGAQELEYPSLSYTPGEVWQIISPDMGESKQLQPEAVNGHVVLAGNARHEVWNIEDPYSPVYISTFESEFSSGEAEAHNNSQLLRDGRHLLATLSGRGVDLWDLTDPAAPVALSHVSLDGIDFGDNSEAVWGLSWQGDALYVGGTNTGIHVLDTSDLSAPTVVTRVPTSAFGGVSAGPLWAVGNTLVVTPPKDRFGLATLDISDPWDPVPLTHLITEDDAYIGGFYAGRAYLVNPWRTYDVLTDPTEITLLSEHATPSTEYMSFADGHAFVGAMRPLPGVHKWDITDPEQLVDVGKIDGRTDGVDNGVFTDDQFGLPVGNLLVMCDDETRHGCVIGVHDAAPDSTPPTVAVSVPADGATGLPVTTRIGLSLTDQIDLRSVTAETVQLLSLDGGDPVPLQFGMDQTVLHLWPQQSLAEDTSYEVRLASGGITDLAGNALASEVSIVFTTGDGTPPPPCTMHELTPVQVGVPAVLSAEPVADATHSWSVGDVTIEGATASHSWSEPGRYSVSLTVSREGTQRQCNGTQIVHPPLPDTPSVHANTVVVDEAHRSAWVVNPDAGTVALLDLDSLTVREEVPVGAMPRTVSVDADGRAWVAVQSDDVVVVLEPDGQEAGRVSLPWGARPYGVAVSGDTAWVTLEGRSALVGVSVDTLGITERIEFGQELGQQASSAGPPVRGLAVSPSGETAWVTRFLSGPDHGELYVVDLASGSVETVQLAHDDTPDDHDAGRGVPNALSSVSLTPDGSRALIPGKKDNLRRGLLGDGETLNPDNTVRTVLAFVDTESREEVSELRVDLDDHELPFAATFSPYADIAFVVSQGTNRVNVVETWSGRVVGAMNTGFAPNGSALTADGLLLVQELNSRAVSVFDVSGFLDGSDSSGWSVATVSTVSNEPLTEQELLGKQLFMNANSSAMSQDGYLACSTCHPDGGHDGQTWDFTQRGEGLRNTIDLRGRAGTGHGRLHWTGNFDEIHDFEADIRLHQGGSGFLSDADWEETQDSLGPSKAGRSERLDALAAYVATLSTYPRSPFRNDDGTLTEAALRGQRVFEGRDCLDCHSGPALTDSVQGLRHDVGTLQATSGERLGGPLDGLDTPTLYGLYASAPYFHDGSASTLLDVLEQPRHGNAQYLSDERKADLVAFLLQLEPDVAVEARGCGCASPGAGGSAWWAGLLALGLGWRRRRSR